MARTLKGWTTLSTFEIPRKWGERYMERARNATWSHLPQKHAVDVSPQMAYLAAKPTFMMQIEKSIVIPSVRPSN